MLPNVNYDSMTDEEFVAILKLDEEEQALLKSIESGEWVSVPNVEQEIQRLQAMAKEQIARQKIEVKMSMQDSNQLYDLAEQLGMSVSAVVQDVMHKYLGGELIEKT
ncbi:MAG: hypothetical protein ACRC6M_19145 [Microcystaceae cyanobacterium]